MYRKFYCDDDLIQKVLAGLQELQSIKAERIQHIGSNEVQEAEREATAGIARTLDRFRDQINYGDTERDENEQLAAVEKLTKEISHEAGYGYGSKDLAQQLKHYFESIQEDKRRAYRTFATLADDLRVKLLAIKFLITSVSHSSTHREKDTKLGMAIEAVDAIAQEVAGLDKDHPHYYEWRHSDIGSWDYAKALTDLHHKKSAYEQLEKEHEALKVKLAQYENGNEKAEPQQESDEGRIPF